VRKIRRRRKRGRTTVERVARPHLSGREPCHVTLRLEPGAPPLRRHRVYGTLRACFRMGKNRFGFRLVHYSVQSNHLHLICEANDRRALSRGMQGLAIRVAKRLNRAVGRTGKLFADRYHLRVLESPTEVRNCLNYVFHNAVKHGALPAGPFFDVFSTAAFFDGWTPKPRLPLLEDGERPVVPATVWLLTSGWRRAGGPLPVSE
jgi:REP element-mobilizing transposase RayT